MALKRELIAEQVHKRWVLLHPDGTEESVDATSIHRRDDLGDGVKRVAEQLVGGARPTACLATIKCLRQLQIADHEPASDSGHLRFYPNGALIYELLRNWQEDLLNERLAASAVRTPVMFDWAREDIRAQAESFDDQLYFVRRPSGDKDFVLRSGGDFGLFSMLADARISAQQLPLRFYELVETYRCFRRSKLSGLQRTRAFSYFDAHSIAGSVEQGWAEFLRFLECQDEVGSALGLDLVFQFTAIDEDFDQWRPSLVASLECRGRAVLVELQDRRSHYWAVKQYAYDSWGNRLFNLQLDAENGPRYGVRFIDSDGVSKDCVVCHNGWGSIERWMFVLFEDALRREVPTLPVWLAPVQVRVIPVASRHEEAALALVRELRGLRVRAQCDERSKSVGARVKSARELWVPYVVVIGDAEAANSELSVDVRGEGLLPMSVLALANRIQAETRGKPWRPISGERVSALPSYH